MGFFCGVCKRGLPWGRRGDIDHWDWKKICRDLPINTPISGWYWGVCTECAPIDRGYKFKSGKKRGHATIQLQRERQHKAIVDETLWR